MTNVSYHSGNTTQYVQKLPKRTRSSLKRTTNLFIFRFRIEACGLSSSAGAPVSAVSRT